MEETIIQKSDTPVKLPILATVFGAYGDVIAKFKSFAVMGSIFAIALSALYLLGGMGMMCADPMYRIDHFCNDSWVVFAAVRLVSFALVCMFARVWYQILERSDEKLNFGLLKPKPADLKIIGMSVLYILSLAVAIVAAYLLYVRVPNPNWKIELLYFTVVALGFFVPLLAMRFLSWYAFIAGGEKLPSWKIIWHKTAGNSFIILLSLALLITLGLFCSVAVLNNFMAVGESNLYMAMLGEYFAHLITLLVVACFMSYCRQQKIFLFERSKDGKSGN